MTDSPRANPSAPRGKATDGPAAPAVDVPAAAVDAPLTADLPAAAEPAETSAAQAPEQATVTSGAVTVSRTSRARVRPRGSRKELTVWYLMRVTAVALFVLALAHFSILHFIYDPAAQTAEFIAGQRWNQLVWRIFDWMLLMTVLFHGFLGVRTVLLDYVHRPGWRTGSLWLLYVIGLFLFIIGTQVILTLPSPGGAS
jgi:succinate dehydrogenase hydrophobic membrane anchor protein